VDFPQDGAPMAVGTGNHSKAKKEVNVKSEIFSQ
jgi:hypothetical protein